MNLSKIESRSCRAGADAREAAGPAVHKSPAALLRKAERDRIADEAKHDRTRQRLFERAFESSDLPMSRAAAAYERASDLGRGAAAIRRCGEERTAAWYDARIKSAAARLPKTLWHLRKLLVNLYGHRGDRIAVKAATWPAQDPRSAAVDRKYWQGVKKLSDFFLSP